LKDGANIRGQYWEREHNKKVVAEMRRDEELKVKARMQKELEDAEQEEARKAQEKRLHAATITREDRAMKQSFMATVVQPRESADNLMSKVFIRPAH